LGDKKTGELATVLTLIFLMANKSKDELGTWDMARNFLSV
jgi:hypothetical protein